MGQFSSPWFIVWLNMSKPVEMSVILTFEPDGHGDSL